MIGLIQTYGIAPIIIVLLIAIPSIVNFIKWCKDLWKQRETFKQENIQQGKAIEAREEAEEHRFEDGEARMKKLEENQELLLKMLKQ